MTERRMLARVALSLLDGAVSAICAAAAVIALVTAMMAGEFPMALALSIAVVAYAAARLGWLFFEFKP